VKLLRLVAAVVQAVEPLTDGNGQASGEVSCGRNRVRLSKRLCPREPHLECLSHLLYYDREMADAGIDGTSTACHGTER
jgi:hypothetical protein